MPEIKKIKIILLIVCVLAVIGALTIILNYIYSQPVRITTEKSDYQTSDILRLKIKNYLNQRVCFSSCYPYYLEKMEGAWKDYKYPPCPTEDVVEKCIEPNKVKAFQLILPSIVRGEHRLAIPACIGCAINQKFSGNGWFYSNEFKVE